MIPCRPDPTKPSPLIVDGEQLDELLIAHEHAVAKRAVEALREIRDAKESDWAYDPARRMSVEALREIEASGWQP